MADPQKPPYVYFAFGVKQKASEYDTRQLLGIKFDEDTVPPSRDPVDYLRERVLTELDRVTLQGSSAATVVLPEFKPPKLKPVDIEEV